MRAQVAATEHDATKHPRNRLAARARAGVSARHEYDMNSLAVPRKAKEAIGGIAALRRPDGTALTINVEYNLLDPLLRANGYPDGDVNDASGWSPFPGLPAQHRMCCALRMRSDPAARGLFRMHTRKNLGHA
jgi:hypothetical protein